MKQCDENCPPDCDNARIYISGMPLDVTVDELVELFKGIGQVREKRPSGWMGSSSRLAHESASFKQSLRYLSLLPQLSLCG